MSAGTQTRVDSDDTTRRSRDRESTEKRLVETAVEMLRTNGVLAGVNLRDVAANAGVARGSIYNFFGSRRQLLRRALSMRIAKLDDFGGVSRLPFVERKMRLFGDDSHAVHSQLVSLLVIDGDDEILPMPFFDDALERMQDDLAAGQIHADYGDDLEALHVAIHTATRGYNTLRSAYARQLGVSVDILDERVRPVFASWLHQLAEPRSTMPESEQS